jgi:benzoate membrane transport protein
LPLSAISAALVAALVGFGASVALLVAAGAALGATPAQMASWLLVISVAKGLLSAALSWGTRVPVVLAWSTPGAALIAGTTGFTMGEGVGAFLIAGGLIALTGLVRPLGRVVGAIPDGVAAAMLAGVLLPFCLGLAPALAAAPLVLGPMVAAFLLVRLWRPALATLAGIAVALGLAFALGAPAPVWTPGLPVPVFIAPVFDPASLVGLALPLVLVTMAGQNLPGFATLRAAGYEPPVRPALVATGLGSAGAALFGAHPFNMAAITAAICLGDDVHPDPARRWVVGLAYGAIWVVLGLLSPLAIAVLAALPAPVLAGIVGLALLSPLMGALGGAFTPAATRFPATVTLAVAASGVAAFGIGGAFWGLCAGLAVLGLERVKPR